jgi:hypothetical protein
MMGLLKGDQENNIIRVILGDGTDDPYSSDTESAMADLEALIDEAIANDQYVVIAFHTDHTEDSTAKAIAFLERMSLTYGAYNNVIYEIFSDQPESSWDADIKPHAETIISAIRSIDPDNLIIISLPDNLSKGINSAYKNTIMGDNIAYAQHLLAPAQSLQYNPFTSKNTGIPLIGINWDTTEIGVEQEGIASVDSAISGGLTINLINISDLINVDVDTDVSTVDVVDVAVDVDVDNQINGDDLEDLADQVMNEDLADAADELLNSELDSENSVASANSAESGGLTVNLINISDLVDVNVATDVSTEDDVDVDVDVDVDNLINGDNLEDLADLIDAAHETFNSDLDDAVGTFFGTLFTE